MNGVRMVFWDWLGTLTASDFLYEYYLKQKTLNLQDNMQELKEYKKEMLDNHWVGYIPYAWSLIKNFHQMGIKQAIATNCSKDQLLAQLENAPFKDFDEILTISEFNPKPDTQMFEYALKKHNIKAQDAIFIGDSANDELVAKALNMQFYAVNSSMMSYFEIANKFNLAI